MSAVILDDWEDQTELGVLAIASHLEDYQLAFILNQQLKTKFKNEYKPTSFKKKARVYNYSVYKSNETRTTPALFLVDNQSVQESTYEENNSLFGSTSFVQSALLESLKKWHYLFICTDAIWLKKVINNINSNDIIYTLSIDIKSLKQNELSLLYSITYD